RIVDAANHVNVDKMLLEFMPEAQMMNGSDSYANIESVRAAFIPAFARLRSQEIKVEQSNIAMLNSIFAWYVASGTFTAIDTSGVTSAPLRFAWTMLFKNNHGDWRVLQAHQMISGASATSV